MQISDHHVRALADIARRLPHDILASLYLEHMLDEAEAPAADCCEAAFSGDPCESEPIRTPDAILTEQHFGGANHQKLVQVIRKRPAPAPVEAPHGSKMQAREDRFVAYVHAHPGCAIGDAMKALGEKRELMSNAAMAARKKDRVEMRGESRQSMRYWPKAAAKSEAA